MYMNVKGCYNQDCAEKDTGRISAGREQNDVFAASPHYYLLWNFLA